MSAQKVQNPEEILSLLMKSKEKEILISAEEKKEIIDHINAVIGYAQICYLGKSITVPKINKAKRNITKHVDELLRYLDVSAPHNNDSSVVAFHQAISYSEEDLTYFGQLSCSLIQLKKEFESFYVYKTTKDEELSKKTNPKGSGAKYDEFNEVIKCLVKIHKNYHGNHKISVRGPSTLIAKGARPVSEDKLITGSLVDFILCVCTPLVFHGRDKKQLEHMIKNCI